MNRMSPTVRPAPALPAGENGLNGDPTGCPGASLPLAVLKIIPPNGLVDGGKCPLVFPFTGSFEVMKSPPGEEDSGDFSLPKKLRREKAMARKSGQFD